MAEENQKSIEVKIGLNQEDNPNSKLIEKINSNTEKSDNNQSDESSNEEQEVKLKRN